MASSLASLAAIRADLLAHAYFLLLNLLLIFWLLLGSLMTAIAVAHTINAVPTTMVGLLKSDAIVAIDTDAPIAIALRTLCVVLISNLAFIDLDSS